MRYFVTGATGFIGRHLCRALIDGGDEVLALVRSPKKAMLLPSEVETISGDLSVFSDVATQLPACDVVVHLAGVVNADTPEDYFRINRDAVGDLVTCVARQSWTPKRLLFASSLAAAGPSPVHRAWSETDELQPVDVYGEAKAAAERLVSKAPFPTTCFRPPLVFGPGDEATLPLYKLARLGLGFRVGATPQRLSYVDVRDVVQGIQRMADDSRATDHTYFLSHPDPVDNDSLWRALGRVHGRSVLIVPLPHKLLYSAMRVATLGAAWTGIRNQLDEKQYRQMVAPAFVCSSDALLADLDWQPRIALDEALRHAADGYRRMGLLA